jgi:hypothetical protein
VLAASAVRVEVPEMLLALEYEDRRGGGVSMDRAVAVPAARSYPRMV